MKDNRTTETRVKRRGWVAVLVSGSLAWTPLAFSQEGQPISPSADPYQESQPISPADPYQESQTISPSQDPYTEGQTIAAPEDAYRVEPKKWSDRESMTNMERVNVRVGGGMEGLGLTLDDRLATGPLWTAAVGVQPLSWMGVEAGYSGSVHEVDSSFLPVGEAGAASGSDFVRNGGQLAVTVNAPTPMVQPYALAGVGFDTYSWRGGDNIAFRDDTSGRVPLGAGLKGAMGTLVGDVRFNYNVLFDQEFARLDSNDEIGSTWDLGLQVGAQF